MCAALNTRHTDATTGLEEANAALQVTVLLTERAPQPCTQLQLSGGTVGWRIGDRVEAGARHMQRRPCNWKRGQVKCSAGYAAAQLEHATCPSSLSAAASQLPNESILSRALQDAGARALPQLRRVPDPRCDRGLAPFAQQLEPKSGRRLAHTILQVRMGHAKRHLLAVCPIPVLHVSM